MFVFRDSSINADNQRQESLPATRSSQRPSLSRSDCLEVNRDGETLAEQHNIKDADGVPERHARADRLRGIFRRGSYNGFAAGAVTEEM